jgi:hypothetical protein
MSRARVHLVAWDHSIFSLFRAVRERLGISDLALEWKPVLIESSDQMTKRLRSNDPAASNTGDRCTLLSNYPYGNHRVPSDVGRGYSLFQCAAGFLTQSRLAREIRLHGKKDP